MPRRRAALLLLNPGKTRRVRLGRRRVYTVEIDAKTRKILAGKGRQKIPRYWIGVPWGSVRALERELRQADRDRRSCIEIERCREDAPDRRGRRRPCRTTFKSKRQAFDALDDALDGQLLALLDQADDGAPELLDLERHTGGGRRRRRLPSWSAALDWLAPSSRRWRDFDPARIGRVSEALAEVLGRNGVTFPGLRLPRQTEKILDAEARQRACDDVAGDRTARAMREALQDLADLVPF